jgi:TorA maturation chaperone TorD
LDACRQLTVALADVPSVELAGLQRYFIHRHLGRWLPQFISRVRAAEAVPPVIHFVFDCLESWLARELSAPNPGVNLAADFLSEAQINAAAR